VTNAVQKSDTPQMFSRIARRYDLLNHVLSFNVDRRWRRELVRTACVPRGGKVLDVATGTADVAIEFARRVDDVQVVGIDPSPGMLDVGRRKVEARRLADRIELLEGDALELPFPDRHFDAVTIAFGLRNLSDYARGAAEMARVLKPFGRLAVLEFAPPAGGLYLKGYNFYLRNVLPIVGGLVSGSREAYRYLAASIGDFLPQRAVEELTQSAGLTDFMAHKLSGGVAYIYSADRNE
jgi:demethylmenaquinone methyltransferase/2-methoxy-6-polyprenyl-1,4-benzoquinol methylase